MRNPHIQGHTPLDLASHGGHLSVADFLMSATNWSQSEIDSALGMAVSGDRANVAVMLTERGASFSRDALFTAKSAEMFGLAFNSNSSCGLRRREPSTGKTVLHHYVLLRGRDEDVYRRLCSHEETEWIKMTPLELAAWPGFDEQFMLLLSCFGRPSDGVAASCVAIIMEQGNGSLFRKISHRGYFSNKILGGGQHSPVALLFSGHGRERSRIGILDDIFDMEGMQQRLQDLLPELLWSAAHSGHGALFKRLLLRFEVASEDINRLTNGTTPLWEACNGGHTKVVKCLLGRKGLGLRDVPNHDGITAIMISVAKERVAILKAMIANKLVSKEVVKETCAKHKKLALSRQLGIQIGEFPSPVNRARSRYVIPNV